MSDAAGGMVGELLAPGGEVCPMVVAAPFKVGQDITTNGVCCAAFRDPPHQRHVSRPLPDQSLEVCLTLHQNFRHVSGCLWTVFVSLK